MASAPFETVILTLAMYGIMLIALTMFTTISKVITRNSIEIRLQEVANQVAMEITAIYSLCHQCEGKIDFFKQIEIPTSISGKGYAIEVKRETFEVIIEGEFKSVETWIVEARLEESSGLKAVSTIWGGNVPVNVETSEGDFQVNSKAGIYEVKYSSIIRSGAYNPVVWARRQGSNITVGIGVAKKTEGA